MNIPFGQILSRAWETTWKYKVLWFFGFLSILAGGVNIQNGLNFNGSGYRFSSNEFADRTQDLPVEIQRIVDWFSQIDWSTVLFYASIIAAVLVILWIVFFLLSVVGRGGLIGGILKADSQGKVTFGEAWALGRRYFWRLLAVKILSFFAVLALIIVVAVPTVIMAIIPLGIIMACPMCLLLIAAVLLLSLYLYFVQLTIVAEDIDLGASFRRAAQVLRERIGPTVAFGLIIFVVRIGVGLLSVALFLPALGTVMAGVLPFIMETGTINMGMVYAGGILFLVMLPVMWLFNSIFETWQTAVYALAYKEYTKPVSAPATIS